jgi:hypothetical protein
VRHQVRKGLRVIAHESRQKAFRADVSRRSRNLISIHNGMPATISKAIQISKISTTIFMCTDYGHRGHCA